MVAPSVKVTIDPAPSAPGNEYSRKLERVQRPLNLREAYDKLKLDPFPAQSGEVSSNGELTLSEERKGQLLALINDGYKKVCTLRPAMPGFVFPTEAERVNACTRLTEDGIENYCLAFKEALSDRDCFSGDIVIDGKSGKFTFQSPNDLVLVQFEDDGPQLAITQETYEEAKVAQQVTNVSTRSGEKLAMFYRKLQLDLCGPYFMYWSRRHHIEFVMDYYNESSFTLCEVLENRLRQYLLDTQMAFKCGPSLDTSGWEYGERMLKVSGGDLQKNMRNMYAIIKPGQQLSVGKSYF